MRFVTGVKENVAIFKEAAGEGQFDLVIGDETFELMIALGRNPCIKRSLDLPNGVEVMGYVPRLFEHLAACDLAIVQGGGTTTLELTALRRPFLYFPLENHFEQQLYVTARLERHQAGVGMSFSSTTAASLAHQISAHIGKEASWPSIPTDGASRAAELLSRLLPVEGSRLQVDR